VKLLTDMLTDQVQATNAIPDATILFLRVVTVGMMKIPANGQ
jgi:hypothetical protein